MSVVILGGNECMERRYKELCQSYKCSAKVFTKPAGWPEKQAGKPRPDDLLHLHHVPQAGAERAQRAEGDAHPHRALPYQLLSALRSILEKHAV